MADSIEEICKGKGKKNDNLETLTINNFGGIKSATFNIKKVTVLIGPQGSGKSVAAKLLYYFRTLLNGFKSYSLSPYPFRHYCDNQINDFYKYFPKDAWPEEEFEISYCIAGFKILIKKNKQEIDLLFPENTEKKYNAIQEYLNADEEIVSSIFDNSIRERKALTILQQENIPTIKNWIPIIPAGRSYFSTIHRSIYRLINNGATFDPFLTIFGQYYQDYKDDYFKKYSQEKTVVKALESILQAKLTTDGQQDYLVHSDGRRVKLFNASSGQQEVLPMLFVLDAAISHENSILDTIFIEEPEAHLFPNAQKKIVELLAQVYNVNVEKAGVFITTHSPYILASFNNLLEAGKLKKAMPEKAEAINAIVPENEQIDPDDFCAYSLENGEVTSLMDEESGLINATILDSVSNEISQEFGELLDIEFGDE